MGRIGVIIVDMPLMAREIIRGGIADASDMYVIAELASPAEAITACTARSAEVVIVGTERAAQDLEALLVRAPAARVLRVQATGERACLYELRPQPVALGDASLDRLLEAIRRGRGGTD